jgi:hypothetical protein
MKANELRIGSLVDWNGEIAKISQILELEVVFTCGESDLTKAIKPIPLTEDFVIDLGLNPVEIENGEWYYQNNKFRLNKNYSGFYYSRNLDVKYVHQLQNLYFALTGEELTLNV